jgi:hypothetical protein
LVDARSVYPYWDYLRGGGIGTIRESPDFHEFAVYDTRIRPNEGDKASTARIFYCTYDEYPKKWDEISSHFSKEAVLRGSFDKYASVAKGKRGTAQFDDAFLSDMENWRALLAHSLAIRNLDLSQRELNFSVQRILDRIIFLRIAEDRGVEPYGQLKKVLTGPRLYQLGRPGIAAELQRRSRIIFDPNCRLLSLHEKFSGSPRPERNNPGL